MIWVMLASAAVMLSACSTTDVVRRPIDVTIGQQLIDLTQAHDSGAMSDREFDQQGRQLIDSVQ